MSYSQPPIFRCRCSALGQLMTPSRSKTGLSETAKSFITLWYKEQLYARRKEVSSKYMTKGNECEEASIAYINSLYGADYKKNEEHYDNDYSCGTPDIVGEDVIIDIKSSWSFDTFPLFSSSLPNRDYWWQVQGYLHLTGKKHGSVVYVLMDTPDELIELEYRRSGGTGLVTPEFKNRYRYNDITDRKLRVKKFDFEYDSEAANQVIDKVEQARSFINSLRY